MDTPMDTGPGGTEARLDAINQQLSWLIARQEEQQELWNELMPIGKLVLDSASGKLEAAEKAGYLEFGKQLLEVGKRVLEHYSADDVRRLGDAIVTVLDGVRALTQPEVMTLAAEAAHAITDADHAKPVGVFGAMRATKDEEVRKGLAVMVEVLRRVGHGVEAMAKKPVAGDDRKAKLAAVLGPRRARVAPPPVRVLPATVPALKPMAAAGPACSTPKPAVAAQVIDGVSFTADGYMTDALQWKRTIGETIAAQQQIAMTEPHWRVIEIARSDFAQTKASPNIRRLTQVSGMSTKDLYALFPKAPGRTIAKIAGLPKPAGCL